MEHSICSTWFYSCRQIYVHINLIHRVIDNVRVIFMLYQWLCNVFFIFCVQTSEEEKFDEDVQAAWEAYLLQLQDASEFVNTQTPLMTQKLEDKYQVHSRYQGYFRYQISRYLVNVIGSKYIQNLSIPDPLNPLYKISCESDNTQTLLMIKKTGKQVLSIYTTEINYLISWRYLLDIFMNVRLKLSYKIKL